MKYEVVLNGKKYEIEVERGEAILIDVSDVQAVAPVAPVSVAAPAPAAVAAPVAAPAAVTGGEVIAAPLPGKILSLAVEQGDAVKAGQLICIIEAMKMENEVLCPRDGTIAAVQSAAGANVETGTPIVVLA
ncbi:MAG: acetyl-CoA carboxylase biotin carboxyl carrier protein subunit [Clostridiaceae bacterium]|jgi:biotin carboxyl carrier protein|nr:acetyl-CoA carboxylase biotin carboxyl carrier protein subunit [Clostridiaceae bacterium]